ncbi:MAG TPA: FecR domain-containing protein [Chitinophagaceae bacterium]|nr:FecR domain-containing protein [Chitinophagaceae bacterium]
MEEEKFWQLLSSKLTGEASGEELKALQQMLRDNPAFALKAQMLSQMWQSLPGEKHNTDDFYNRHLQRLSNRPDIPALPEDDNLTTQPLLSSITTATNRKRWLWPAAGIAAACLFVFAIRYMPPRGKMPIASMQQAQKTVSTRKGSKSTILLPDGSTAWLNADSKITYQQRFVGNYREVTLEGEAYFDIVKDKTKPFIIHTKRIDIRVLGTAFNVRAYATENNTETSLFRGSVEVTLHDSPGKKIILKPNEKLLVKNPEAVIPAASSNTSAGTKEQTALVVGKVHREANDSSAWETLWMKNKLVFDAESLEEVAQKMERWYDVKVIIRGNEELRQTTYSAIFESETLLQVLEALKITGNFTYSVNRDIVTIQ